MESYSKTLKTGKTSWMRPKIENEGVYRALNELNPNLLGFTVIGLPSTDDLEIRQGLNTLPVGKGCGDGHDRYGVWTSLSGTEYRFQANWRAGTVMFTSLRRRGQKVQ